MDAQWHSSSFPKRDPQEQPSLEGAVGNIWIIFQNIRITDLLWHKAINEKSLHNSAQSMSVVWMSLTVFLFACVLQTPYTFSSHLPCSCMSLLNPKNARVFMCTYKTSFNTHKFCCWWMHFTTLVLQSPSLLLTLLLLCSFTYRWLQHLFQDF